MTDKEKGSYEYRLKLERDRERSYRKTGQGAFTASMQSLDALTETFDDPSVIRRLSDHGRGAEAINRIDSDEEVINEALSRLDDSDRDFARAVLKGMAWQTSGLTRQGFNWRLRSIIKKILALQGI